MDANTLRRLNWLWKHRHTHTGNELTDVERRLIVVEEQADKTAGTSSGAYIHLGDAAGQEIDDGGEAVTFTSILKTPLNFAVTAPTDEVLIQVPGYYDAQISLVWESYSGGGGVWVTRTRGGESETVWPLVDDQWVAANGRRFVDNMPALECRPGDVLQLWVDPAAGSAQNLERASFTVRLLDRAGGSTVGVSAPEAGAPDTDIESSALSIGGTSSYSVPLPESQEDDLLVMFVSSTQTASVTGWSELDSAVQLWGGVNRRVTVLWKVAEGDEGTTTTLSFAGNSGFAMAAMRFREASTDWSTTTPSVDLSAWDSSNPLSFPEATPIHGAGNYWVIPFVASNEFGAPVSGADGYPQIAYATHVHAWERMWVGAAYEAVSGSVTPPDITYAGGVGGAHMGVLLVKGGS